VVTKDCVLDNGESTSWRAGLRREVLEAREWHVNVQEGGMMTLMMRVMLCIGVTSWTCLLGEMVGLRSAGDPGGEPGWGGDE